MPVADLCSDMAYAASKALVRLSHTAEGVARSLDGLNPDNNVVTAAGGD
jgi:hypothetical protein